MRRLTEGQKGKIMELQKNDISDAEISRRTGIPYSIVYYQRPEVRERMRERMRVYYQRSEVKEHRRKPDPYFQEFLGLVQKIENGDLGEVQGDFLHNPYIGILKYMYDNNFGKRYKQIARKVGKKIIISELRKLRKSDMIGYNPENKKYSLSYRGKELCEHLFKC